VYEARRLEGDERFRLSARVLENRRALNGGCERRCGHCDDCLRIKFWLWSRLCEPSSAVYALENGAGPCAVVVWVGNELHGHAWDGKLLGKTGVIRELVEDRLQDYPVVRMTVPMHSKPIARWAQRLGFHLSYVTNGVYHLWRIRDGIRR
jgi:hypothetical protein